MASTYSGQGWEDWQRNQDRIKQEQAQYNIQPANQNAGYYGVDYSGIQNQLKQLQDALSKMGSDKSLQREKTGYDYTRQERDINRQYTPLTNTRNRAWEDYYTALQRQGWGQQFEQKGINQSRQNENQSYSRNLSDLMRGYGQGRENTSQNYEARGITGGGQVQNALSNLESNMLSQRGGAEQQHQSNLTNLARQLELLNKKGGWTTEDLKRGIGRTEQDFQYNWQDISNALQDLYKYKDITNRGYGLEDQQNNIANSIQELMKQLISQGGF